MKKMLLLVIFLCNITPVAAKTINLASKQYVDDNCITISTTNTDTQTLKGNYTVTGTFNVPTPPLPPEE